MSFLVNWDSVFENLGLTNGETGVPHVYDYVPTSHMLITGGTGDGKTQLVASMIMKFFNYNQVLILTAKPDERIYQALRIMLEDQVGEEIIHMYDDVEEFPKVLDLESSESIHRIVVFDDLVTLAGKDQKKIEDYFSMGRKASCQCLYLTQSFFKTPIFIRNQCKSFIFFLKTMTNKANLCYLRSAMFSDLTQKQFDALRRRLGAHDSVLVDVLSDHPKRYRINLGEEVDPNKLI